MTDSIHIEELELQAHIGVPEEERAAPQRLTANLMLEPMRGFGTLDDDLTNAVDYFAVCQAVKDFAAERPRRLIETLAEEIARLLLARFRVSAVEVEIRKYILPETKYVAVRVRRGT
jgi:dihydroneopterin aldolase